MRPVPPPLPVSLRLESEPWNFLSKSLVFDLRMHLTNSGDRGDLKDDGVGAGSLFRDLIDQYNDGLQSGQDWWAVTAWQSSDRLEPIAWCLLRPESSCVVPTFRTGIYTQARWRNRGIGRILINESIRLGHRLGYSRLVASPWNQRSESFFESAGFSTIAPRCGAMSGLAEFDINDCPDRLPWRCRPPTE